MLDARFYEQAINHYFDGVVLALVEGDIVLKVHQFPVHAGSGEAVLDEFFHLFFELTFASANNRRHYHHPVFGSEGHHPLHNLVG